MIVGSERTVTRAQAGQGQAAAAIRIILADGLAIVRAGTKALLNAIKNAEVVAEAASGAELLQLASAAAANLVVMETALPDMDGVAAIAKIRQMREDIKIVVLTTNTEPEQLRRAIEAGTNGILGKDASVMSLDYCVGRVMAHGQYFASEITARLLQPREKTPYDELTDRQVEVLTLIAQGYQSKQIAHDLGLSSKTVDVHRVRIMDRLNIKDIANLTRYAIRKGLIAP